MQQIAQPITCVYVRLRGSGNKWQMATLSLATTETVCRHSVTQGKGEGGVTSLRQNQIHVPASTYYSSSTENFCQIVYGVRFIFVTEVDSYFEHFETFCSQ